MMNTLIIDDEPLALDVDVYKRQVLMSFTNSIAGAKVGNVRAVSYTHLYLDCPP